jgi:hypothetical protein
VDVLECRAEARSHAYVIDVGLTGNTTFGDGHDLSSVRLRGFERGGGGLLRWRRFLACDDVENAVPLGCPGLDLVAGTGWQGMCAEDIDKAAHGFLEQCGTLLPVCLRLEVFR